MVASKLQRLTVLSYLTPRRFIDTEHCKYWRGFDLEQWSSELFTWEQDEFNGALDWVSHPMDTVGTGRGDCDDYAFVAATALFHQTERPITIAYLIDLDFSGPYLAHVVVYDGERVYSSGGIIDESLPVYVRKSEYEWRVTRRLR